VQIPFSLLYKFSMTSFSIHTALLTFNYYNIDTLATQSSSIIEVLNTISPYPNNKKTTTANKTDPFNAGEREKHIFAFINGLREIYGNRIG